MRGLKQHETLNTVLGYEVASFTDAWIETSTIAVLTVVTSVASFTDAWIETDRKCESTRRRKSHLLQMRGLKPNLSH